MIESITIDSTDDDDGDDDPAQPPPPVHRSPGPACPRSSTLGSDASTDNLVKHANHTKADDEEEEEDQLADDDWNQPDSFQSTSILLRSLPSPSPRPQLRVQPIQTRRVSRSLLVESAAEPGCATQSPASAPSGVPIQARSGSSLVAAPLVRVGLKVSPPSARVSRAKVNRFPFSKIPSRMAHETTVRSVYAGLGWQVASSGRRILAPQRAQILNHDRGLPRPPSLTPAHSRARPSSILRYELPVLALVSPFAGAKDQNGNQAKLARREANMRRRQLSLVHSAVPGTASSPARLMWTKQRRALGGKEPETSDGELSSDPELAEADKLDFSLLEVRDHKGCSIGRVSAETLLKSYERWESVRVDSTQAAPHRARLRFEPKKKEDQYGPPHSQRAIAQMEAAVKLNKALALEHATTPCLASSRPKLAHPADAGPSHSAPAALASLNTVWTPLKPASMLLPSGWPSLRAGAQLDAQRMEEAARRAGREFQAELRKLDGSGLCVGFHQLVVSQARKKEMAEIYGYEDADVVKALGNEEEAEGGPSEGPGGAQMERHNPRPARSGKRRKNYTVLAIDEEF